MKSRPVAGYEGFYRVSENGVVARIVNGGLRNLRPITHPTHGYCVVNLSKHGVIRQHRVHILVATSWIENPEAKPTVNHKDGNKTNNCVANLEWATSLEQGAHASQLGLVASGDRNRSTKLTISMLTQVRDELDRGEQIRVVASRLGVNRNTLTRAMNRYFQSNWGLPLREKRSRAALIRWSQPSQGEHS